MSAPPPGPPPPPEGAAASDGPDGSTAGSSASVGATTAERGTATPPRRLTRRTDGHLLAGVASGIADHLDVDPVLVRVGFVVLAVWPFPGFGVLLYVALTFLLPAEEGGGVRRAPRAERERGLAFYVGVALLVVAVLALLGATGAPFAAAAPGGWLVPLVLIGVGVALWVSDRGESDPGAARAPVPTSGGAGAGVGAGPSTVPAAAAVDAAAAPSTGAPVWGTDPPTPPTARSAPPVAWDPPPPRPRSPLGRWTLGAALTIAAGLWALQILGVGRPIPPSGILATSLGILGVGLLIGSVTGRARWLAWLAAPLAALLLATAVLEDLGLPLTAGVGDRVVVLTGDEVDADIVERLGAGRLVIDLTRLDPDDLEVASLDVVVGAGELEVVVPQGVRLTGRARVEVGQYDVEAPDRWRSYGGIVVDETVDVGPADGVPIAADLRVGAGQIVVREAPHVDAAEEMS